MASSSSSLDRLVVRRRRAAGGKVEYTFKLPDGRDLSVPRTQVSRDALERDLLNAATRLHHWSLGGAPDPAAGEQHLSQLGGLLTERYVPGEALEFLFGSTAPLAIETNDPEFPWELLNRGDVYLGVHRPISRLISSRRRTRPGLERWGADRAALLVGNPTQEDSSKMEREVSVLDAELKAHNPPYATTPLTGAAASYSAVKDLLQGGVELFHFAGHVYFEPGQPAITGLVFPNGLTITTETLEETPGEFAFVFINGCASGRAAQQSGFDPAFISSGRRMDGLAAAFIEKGAGALIGTLWPVADESAYGFAHTFYQHALAGYSFGESLQKVRQMWRAKYAHNPTWAAYILYGDPRLTLDTVRDPHANLAEVGGVPAPARVVLPSGAVVTGARMRGPRAEEFFRNCLGSSDDDDDETPYLAPSGVETLERTLAWVTRARWRLVARFDLFLGLALTPESLVARGLEAYGVSVDEIQHMNMLMFGAGPGAPELPDPSRGVATAIRRAEQFARADGRREVRADDIAHGLLDMSSVSGSLQRALDALEMAPRDLLAAGAGGPVKRTPAWPPSSGGLMSGVITPMELGAMEADLDGDKADVTPRKLLRNLREQVDRAQRRGGLRPCIGRERELGQVIQIRTRPYSPTITPHVVIRGPAGVGCLALAYALAAKLKNDPDAGELALIRDWAIAAVRVSRESDLIDAWLRNEVTSRGEVTILVIEDLPELMRFPGLPETLAQVASHPNIRVVAVSDDIGYRTVREHATLARLLNVVELAPPRPELAVEMTQAHVARLQKRYEVIIAPDVAAEAVRLAPRYSRLALPGGAITLLERACAAATRRLIAASAELDWLEAQAEDAEEPAPATPGATTAAEGDTVDLLTPPQITAQSLQAFVAGDDDGAARSSAL